MRLWKNTCHELNTHYPPTHTSAHTCIIEANPSPYRDSKSQKAKGQLTDGQAEGD